MLKRSLCLLLCMALITTILSCAAEEKISVSDLMDQISEENAACKDAEEQLALGVRYVWKLTQRIVRRLDPSDAYQTLIDDVVLQAEGTLCRDTHQQCASDLYAASDLLLLAAARLDTDGSRHADVEAIQARLSQPQKSSPEQQVNGAQTMLETLCLLSELLDPTEAWQTTRQTILADHTASLEHCQGPQHMLANSLYRSCSMAVVLAMQLDQTRRWLGTIQGIEQNLADLDLTCTSSVQQDVNGAFRLVELMAVIAMELESSD